MDAKRTRERARRRDKVEDRIALQEEKVETSNRSRDRHKANSLPESEADERRNPVKKTLSTAHCHKKL